MRGHHSQTAHTSSKTPKTGVLHVNRPVFNQNDFQEKYEENRLETLPLLGSHYQRQSIADKCRACCPSLLHRIFPFLLMLQNYDVRNYLPMDALSGITTGFMRIPQAMAYATLAQMQPVFGLYTAFCSSLLYFFIGGSNHLMIGPQGVVSLMVGSTLKNVLRSAPATSNISSSILTNMSSDINPYDDPIAHVIVDIVVTITFTAGLLQATMGLLQLGFITNYLSDPLVGGFTTGAACSVLVSQLPTLFGLRIATHSGTFNMIYSLSDLFISIEKMNYVTILLSLASLTLLVFIKWANAHYTSHLKVPLPGELILLTCSILLSHFTKLADTYQVKTVGAIPSGFLPPHSPNMNYVFKIIPLVTPLAIISFTIAYALGKRMALKNCYSISGNQELFALGFVNIASSFFSCFPTSASMSVTSLHESLGGRTQIASLFSSLLILATLFFMGDLFAPTPKCVLSVIILCSLKSIFSQFKDLIPLWRLSKIDFLLWLVTWCAVILFDVDVGLAVGVVFSLMTIVFRTQWTYTCVLGRIPQTDIYKNQMITPTAETIPGCVIFRFEGPLYFASAEHFRHSLYRESGCNPFFYLRQSSKTSGLSHEIPHEISSEHVLHQSTHHQDVSEIQEEQTSADNAQVHHIILDFSVCSFLDSVGLRTLVQVIDEYETIGIIILLSNVRAIVRRVFLQSIPQRVDTQRIYISNHDAVLAALEQAQQWQVRDRLVSDVSHDNCYRRTISATLSETQTLPRSSGWRIQ